MERPILFNTEMVKAILDNRKTSTRRIIKRTPSNDEPCGYGFWKEFNERDNTCYVKDYTHSCTWWPLKEYIDRFSRYHVGDILYVRETWAIQSMSNYDKRIKFMYRASDDMDLEARLVTNNKYEELLKYESKNGWQPSLFMPKEAARIFLKVKDVRIERLHDITEEGAKAEGAIKQLWYQPYGTKSEGRQKYIGDITHQEPNYITGFAHIWDKTLGRHDDWLYKFNENP